MAKSFSNQESLFIDETVLHDSYIPEKLPEREDELNAIHDALVPATRGAKPHNTFIYGKTGQGKSVAVRHRLRDLQSFSETSEALDLTVVQYACNGDTTSYQVATGLVKELTGKKRPRGLEQKKVFDMLYDELNSIGGTVIFVLDEIDSIGTNDDILYEIPRARSNGYIDDMWVTIVGISNDFNFRNNLSPKVKDTLAEDEVHFSPYNATQLRPILERRAEKAFRDGILTDDVIPLCAALAGQDKGSARQAIRYLYKSVEVADNNQDDMVTEHHVRKAEEKIEKKNLEKGIRELTTQDHLGLSAIVSLEIKQKSPAKTREVYGEYKRIATMIDSEVISLRRVRDHLQELDLVGIVNSKKQGNSHNGGAHYVWRLDSDLGMTLEVLEDNNRFEEAIHRIKSTKTRSRTLDNY